MPLKLPDSFSALLTQLKLELEQLYARVEEMDKVIQHRATDDGAANDSLRSQESAR